MSHGDDNAANWLMETAIKALMSGYSICTTKSQNSKFCLRNLCIGPVHTMTEELENWSTGTNYICTDEADTDKTDKNDCCSVYYCGHFQLRKQC